MKINVGIVGYGNLGKAAEKAVLANKGLSLVAIFSRRLVCSPYSTKIESYENFKNYQGKIDVMLLCGGSHSDLIIQTPEIAKYFDVINTFDTHKKIPEEFDQLNKIASSSGTRAIMSCGWDPGIFSMMRAMFFVLSDNLPVTFWGKGISMGHSDAARRVENVEDAVEFTIPNAEALKLARAGKPTENLPLHFRECYVVAKPKHQPKIECEIKNIKNYFKGQPTKVNFVSREELLKLKSKMLHKGEVISTFKTIQDTKCKLSFAASMQSNPDFTANIMTKFIGACLSLKEQGKCGAFTPLDISMSDLLWGTSREEQLKLI